MKPGIPRLASLLLLLLLGISASADERSLGLFPLSNDTISLLFNDERFPLDDFDYPAGTTHLNNLYIGFYDGSTGYYFNNFVQGGNSSLVLLEPMEPGGTAPTETLTMTFGNADPPTRFSMEVVVEMLGDGAHALRGTATITNLLAEQSLTGTQFYLFTDVAIVASEGGDVTAYDSESGIFYAYDQSNAPNTWFGCHGDGRYPLHYAGYAYQGPVGLAPFHSAMVQGESLENVAESTAQDQVAGWNWPIGTIADQATVGFAIGAHDSLASLIEALEAGVPANTDQIFVDDFEEGDLSAWSPGP